LFVSVQGGYFDPVYYETLGGHDVSYACKDGINSLPLLSFIEGEIAQFMAQDSEMDNIQNCISDGFNSLESRGINVEYSFGDLALPTPRINNDGMAQDIDFSYNLKKGTDVAQVGDLRVDVPSSLRAVYDIAVDVVNTECSGIEFDIDDYVWEASQAYDVLAASIANSQIVDGYQPWYLTSFDPEGNGESLRFHFIIEQ